MNIPGNKGVYRMDKMKTIVKLIQGMNVPNKNRLSRVCKHILFCYF